MFIFSLHDGLSKYVNVQEQNIGLQIKGGYDYTLGSAHKGSMMLGAEYSNLHFYGLHSQIGYDYDYETSERPEMKTWCLGHENSANVALQLKHQWHSLILNAGLRFDHKHRIDNTNVNEWSPRIALILLRPTWNMKLSYSKSFVDFPYILTVENLLWYSFYENWFEYFNFIEPAASSTSVANTPMAASPSDSTSTTSSTPITTAAASTPTSSHSKAAGSSLR